MPEMKEKLGVCAGGGKPIIPQNAESQWPYDFMLQNIVRNLNHDSGVAMVYIAQERRRQIETFLAPWIRQVKVIVVHHDNDEGLETGGESSRTTPSKQFFNGRKIVRTED